MTKSFITKTRWLVTIILLTSLSVGQMWATDIAKWGKVSISANTNVYASGGDANNSGVAKFQSTKAMTTAGGNSSKCYYGSSAGGAVITFSSLNLSSYSSIQMTFYARASQSGFITVAYSTDGTNWVNVGAANVTTSEGQKTITGIPWFATYLRLTHSKTSGSLYFGTTVISGTSAASKTVTWYVNGSTTTAGSPTTSVPSGGTVAKLPTDPSSCDPSKVFVGWTNSTYSHATDAPSVLFTTVQGAPTVTANTSYHAVFANRTDFTRVTSTSDLATGKQIVVVDDYNSKVLTTVPGYATAPTESSSKITPTINMIWFLEANSTNWKLKTGSAYLGTFNTESNTDISYSSSNNVWTIGSSSSGTNNFYFKNTSGTNFCLEYNSSGTKWVGYVNASYSSSTYFTERLYVATLTNYVTSCASCGADPTVGTASLNGSFTLSSVPLQASVSDDGGTGCTITDAGFVWKSGGTDPTIDDNKTSGTYSTNITGTIPSAGTFSVGVTYKIKAYATNGHGDGLSSSSFTLIPRLVTFYKNDGVDPESTSTQYVNNGASTALTANSFSRTGYTFNGWNTNRDGTSGANYADGANITASGGNVDLYAKWNVNSYTVAFNANGGTGDAMANQSFDYDETKALSANTYTAPEHKYFLGWNTNSAATTATYTDGKSVSNLAATDGATVTLYAIWKEHTYTNYRTNCCEKPTITINGTGKTVEDGKIVFPLLREDLDGTATTTWATLDITFSSNSAGAFTVITNSSKTAAKLSSWKSRATTGGTWANVSNHAKFEITSAGNARFSVKTADGYTGQGTYRIGLHQDANGDNCAMDVYIFVDVTLRDKFVDNVNDNEGPVNKDGHGAQVATPALSEFGTQVENACHSEGRKLKGWIKETDLQTLYESGTPASTRVQTIDGLCESCSAGSDQTSLIKAPGANITTSGATWYAVWAYEK